MRQLQLEHHQGGRPVHRRARPTRAQVALALIGRKGRDFFRRRGFDVRYEAVGIFAEGRRSTTRSRHGRRRHRGIHSGRVDQRASRLQRVQVGDDAAGRRRRSCCRFRGSRKPSGDRTGDVDYLYEPAPEEIFNALLPRYVQVQVFRALLESNAAFFAAQMTAMDAATRNSSDMIENLTLYMNKVRQAAITREIIEVVSGAAAT